MTRAARCSSMNDCVTVVAKFKAAASPVYPIFRLYRSRLSVKAGSKVPSIIATSVRSVCSTRRFAHAARVRWSCACGPILAD